MPAVYNSTSRYSLDTGGTSASRKSDPITGGVPYTLHMVKEGDTIENIAARYLGRHSRYWEISDLNPQIKFPTDIEAGTVIRLPR
jgi:nucleoid-associated protein YgaU